MCVDFFRLNSTIWLFIAIILGNISVILYVHSQKTEKDKAAKIFGILSIVVFALYALLQGVSLY
jgi:hypothetical protein